VLLDLYPNRGLAFTRGEGMFLFTRDGRRYLDLGATYGASLLGHAHPAITSALAQQGAQLAALHGSFGSDVRGRASVALASRLPMPSPSLCWTNSGTEAIEAALKFAVLITGRRRSIAFTGAYHGKTLGALSATHGASYRSAFEPLLWDFAHVPYGDLEAVDAAIDSSTAAVIVEPIQGESGILEPAEGFLTSLRDLCRARGVLLVVDEIQTGCGRTGHFTVCDTQGVAPDILCLGKGLGGGMPVGVTAVASQHAASISRGSHTSTFGGNPLAAACVLAVLSTITDELLTSVRAQSDWFRAELAAIAGAVRGRGYMLGVPAGARRDTVLKALQQAGVIAIPAGKDVVRFLPALTAERGHLELALDALRTLRSSFPPS
jgi:LysW-gamma-L-lysine/LysW-L-ornithine aminotransferase